jgi:hypothetical protein
MDDSGLLSRWRSFSPYFLSVLRIVRLPVHAGRHGQAVNQGMDAIFCGFLWLYLSAAWSGPWGLDALRSRRVPSVSI